MGPPIVLIMKYHWILYIFLIATVISCRHEVSTREIISERSTLHAAYLTNDLQAAEDIFFNDLRTLSNWQSNHAMGIEFNACQALDHQGLFFIYRKAHLTNQMNAEFQLCISSVNASRRHFGLPPEPTVTMDELATAIAKRERITFELSIPTNNTRGANEK